MIALILTFISIILFVYMLKRYQLNSVCKDCNKIKINDFLNISNEYNFSKRLMICQKCHSINIKFGPYYINGSVFYYYCENCNKFINDPILVEVYYNNNDNKTYLIGVDKYKLYKKYIVNNIEELIQIAKHIKLKGETL